VKRQAAVRQRLPIRPQISNAHNYSFGAASFLASRFFCRRSRREAACFSRLAFRLTFFFASISFRLEVFAGFVVAMIFQMLIAEKNVQ